MKNIIFLDLDGTLIRNSDKKISNYTINILLKLRDNGFLLAVNSGRPLDGLPKNLLSINPDFYVLNNGSIIIDKDKTTVLYEKTMDKTLVKHLFIEACKYQLLPLCFINNTFVTSEAYYKLMNDGYDPYNIFKAVEFYKDVAPVIENHNNKIYKLVFLLFNEKQDFIFDIFRNKFPQFDYTSFSEDSIEIISKNNNKATAVRYLCNKLNISLDKCVAMGDSDNDKEMLEIAGIAIVPSNACLTAKNVASYIADSCDDDGPAKLLEELYLKGGIKN